MRHMYFSLSVPVLVFLLLGVFGTKTANAQMARLTGTVTDASGLIVPGAELTVTNQDTGVSYQTKSNATGTYSLGLLPPGRYTLEGEFQGFKKFNRPGIVLETGFVRTVDIELDVGAVTETITVEASTPLLQSETSDVAQLIERATIQNAPLSTRRVASLVRLMGAVSFSQEKGHTVIPAFSLAGGRSLNQMWTLDGIPGTNSTLGTAQLLNNPSQEAVQEFKIDANNYSADLGHNGGGFIQITTRSGTNSFHGSLYEYLRNDRLDARTFFAPGKAPLRWNIFGGSLGGPIIRNKTFFFVNVEAGRQRIGQTFSGDDLPHPADRTGDFSNRLDVTVLDPLTGDPFPGNIIPPARLDPVARFFVDLFPLPNRAGNDITRAPRNNYLANASGIVDQINPLVRIDHNHGNSDRFFFRFFGNDTSSETANPWRNQAFTGKASDSTNRQFSGGWTHILSPTSLNEFRVGYLTTRNLTPGFGFGSDLNAQAGLPGVPPGSLSSMNITGYSKLGNSRRDLVPKPSFHLKDNVSWRRGTHNFKTGMEYRRDKFGRDRDEPGTFKFSNRATKEGLAAFLLGWTTSASINSFDLLTRTSYWGAYVMDDWKVTPRLTLNLGLRWEMDTPPFRDDNKVSSFDGTAINPVSGNPGVVTFAPFPDTGKRAFDFEWNNWSPRFGFAYRPRGNWVVRGGYGLMYYQPLANFSKFQDAGFSETGSFSSIDGGFTPAFLLRDGLPPLPGGEERGPGFGAVPLGEKTRFAPDFMEQNKTTPYSQQWNFGIQRQLPGEILVEVTYLANVAHKLVRGNISRNMIPLINGRGPATQDQILRPFPQFSDVIERNPTFGNSSYHGLNLKLEKRHRAGLNFLMNYTWSRYLDDITANTTAGAEREIQHIELLHLAKALSGSHVAHRFVSYVGYDLPWGQGRRFGISNPALNVIAGGWTVSTITEFVAGAPYAVYEQTNRSNTFSPSQRPNVLHNPELDSDRARGVELAEWFDTSAFEAPGAGIFGTAARSYCCGPGGVIIDVSVKKRIAVSEGWGLTFAADFYNLPNIPRFASPSGQRGRGDFGRVGSTTSGSTGRQIQLSLRLDF